MGHSITSPSSAVRWWNCSGSPHLIATLPEQSNVSLYSAQGTAAHHIAALLLMGLPDTSALDNTEALDGMWIHVPYADDVEPTIATVKEKLSLPPDTNDGFWFEICWDDNDGTVSLEHVNSYVDYVFRETLKYGLLKEQISIEEEVLLYGLDVGGKPRKGTVDCAFAIPMVKLQVIDLKFGKGVSVDVENNLQLLDYALGKWDLLTQEERDLIPVIETTIHQPRRGGLKTFVFPSSVLETYRYNLTLALKDVELNPGSLVAGDWCVDTFCPAKSICPAAAEYKEQSMRASFANLLVPEQSPIPGTEVILTESNVALPKASNMTNDGLSLVLERTPYIRNWLETMELEALRRAKNGEVIAGRKLVERDKHRIYPDEKAVVDLLDNCGVPQSEWYAPRKLKTPNQVELTLKKYNKGAVETAKALAQKPKGEIILASADDKRPAVSIATSEQNFGNLITDVEVIHGND